MDEQFTGYGYDDVDWCIRAIQHGYFLIDRGSIVRHIDDSCFRSDPGWAESYARNEALLREKWADRVVIR
jgi:GT2 family glycosyltransferase